MVERLEKQAAAGPGGRECLCHVQVSWTPSRDTKQMQSAPERVTPLTGMLLRLLTDHIQDVESLWGLPDVLRVMLSAEFTLSSVG